MLRNNPTLNRRLKKSDFQRFFESGVQNFSLQTCAIYRISNSFGAYRLGITIKVPGTRSVDRNKVRRIIQGFFNQIKENLGSFDYNVVISRQKTLRYPFPERLKEALDVFAQKHLQKTTTKAKA